MQGDWSWFFTGKRVWRSDAKAVTGQNWSDENGCQSLHGEDADAKYTQIYHG